MTALLTLRVPLASATLNDFSGAESDGSDPVADRQHPRHRIGRMHGREPTTSGLPRRASLNEHATERTDTH